MKKTITAIIIAKNEEDRLQKCLSHLSWCSQIIVVDNGSTDRTEVIAKSVGAVVIKSPGKDFSGVREAGLRAAKSTWVLYIDADETVNESLQAEIREVIKQYSPGKPTAYYIIRDTYYLGYHWPYKDKVQRLFFAKELKGWHGRLHETPVYAGEAGTFHSPLLHKTHRSITEMLTKTNDWSDIEARLRIEAHHPPVVWWRFLRVMGSGFTRSYVDQRGFQAGTVGWIESIYQAFSMFVTYAKLWELQQKNTGRS